MSIIVDFAIVNIKIQDSTNLTERDFLPQFGTVFWIRKHATEFNWYLYQKNRINKTQGREKKTSAFAKRNKCIQLKQQIPLWLFQAENNGKSKEIEEKQ